MTTHTLGHNDLFVRAFATSAMLGPMLLVMIAGALPEGPARAELIVSGNGGIVIALAAALVLRAVYGLGFNKAFKLAAENPDYSVTA
ncbi:MAG: hypothetical protein ACLP0B_07395 [Steroidobacteraceae bacterium]|jgi:hypothetical protein